MGSAIRAEEHAKTYMFLDPISVMEDTANSNVTPENAVKETIVVDVAPAPVDGDPYIGTLFENKYLIETKLGAGGMSVVYRAKHILMDRPVAIKFLHIERTFHDRAIEYFKQEARAAGRIQHPNATNVLDFGHTNGIFYLVMEYLEGETLRDRLKKVGKFSYIETVDILNQVCEVVATVHQCGIIHCDLKPDNIFLQQKGDQISVKVLDFGIAKIIKDGSIVNIDPLTGTATSNEIIGTPHYMSPEQCQNDELNHLTDIYSIGIIAFEMLTGQLPFNGNSPVAVAVKHLNAHPPKMTDINPNISPIIEKVIMRALEKRPSLRQSSASIFAEELAQLCPKPAGKTFDSLSNLTLKCTNANCKQPEWSSHGHCANCQSLLVGTLLDNRYKVKERIIKGCFGSTYLVVDKQDSDQLRILKDVNLNSLENDYQNTESELALRLFKLEAAVMMDLDHPGIAKLLHYFAEGNNYYLVQEYIEGQLLSEDLDQQKQPLNEENALAILSELADILEYLHARTPQIIHRDIKPQNLMRTKDGKIKLVDFGALFNYAINDCAQQTFIGSPGFAPPEQLMGETCPQSDIYAAAVTIVNLLTGIAPARHFNRNSMRLEWSHKVSVNASFANLLEEMLNPNVEKRLATATELRGRIVLLNGIANINNNCESSSTNEPAEAKHDEPVGTNASTPTIDIQAIANFCYEVETKWRSIENANYYQFLDIERNVSCQEVEQAYEVIINRFHPDNYRELIAHNQLLHLQLSTIVAHAVAAYSMLNNPVARNNYNQSLRNTGRLNSGNLNMSAFTTGVFRKVG